MFIKQELFQVSFFSCSLDEDLFDNSPNQKIDTAESEIFKIYSLFLSFLCLSKYQMFPTSPVGLHVCELVFLRAQRYTKEQCILWV